MSMARPSAAAAVSSANRASVAGTLPLPNGHRGTTAAARVSGVSPLSFPSTAADGGEVAGLPRGVLSPLTPASSATDRWADASGEGPLAASKTLAGGDRGDAGRKSAPLRRRFSLRRAASGAWSSRGGGGGDSDSLRSRGSNGSPSPVSPALSSMASLPSVDRLSSSASSTSHPSSIATFGTRPSTAAGDRDDAPLGARLRLSRLRKVVTVGPTGTAARAAAMIERNGSVQGGGVRLSGGGGGGGGGGGDGMGSEDGGADPDALRSGYSASSAVRTRSARAALGVPSVPLSRLGVSWARDVFVVVHNSMRLEARDMASMLVRLVGQTAELVEGDWESFWGWVEVWRGFVSRMLDAEEEVLLPWAEGDTPLPLDGGFSREDRSVHVNNLRRVVDKLGAHRGAFDDMSPTRRVARLRAILDKWVTALERFFLEVETRLPPLLEVRAADPAAAEAASAEAARLLAAHIADGPEPRMHLVLLLRSLEGNRKALGAWKSAALDRKTSLSLPLWRGRVAASHYETIDYFLRKTNL